MGSNRFISAIQKAFDENGEDLLAYVRGLTNGLNAEVLGLLLGAVDVMIKDERDSTRRYWLQTLKTAILKKKKDEKKFHRLLERLLVDPDVPDQVEVYIQYMKANELIGQSMNDKAEEICLGVLEKHSSMDKPALLLHVVMLGSSKLNKGKCREAVKFYEVAIEKSREMETELLLGSIYNNLAAANAHMGKEKEAISAYNEVLRLASERRSYAELGITLSNMADFMLYQDKPEEALRYAERAVAESSRVENDLAVAVAHFNLAEALFVMGSYVEAIETLQRARLFIHSSGNLFLEVEAGLLESIIRLSSGEDKSISRLEEAITFAEENSRGRSVKWLVPAYLEYAKRVSPPCGKGCAEALDKAGIIIDKLSARPYNEKLRKKYNRLKRKFGRAE